MEPSCLYVNVISIDIENGVAVGNPGWFNEYL